MESKRYMSGIDMIHRERTEQIFMHGRTPEYDAEMNRNGQLVSVMQAILFKINGSRDAFEQWYPREWNREFHDKLIGKSFMECLVLIGAFAAAEIDRQNYMLDVLDNVGPDDELIPPVPPDAGWEIDANTGVGQVTQEGNRLYGQEPDGTIHGNETTYRTAVVTSTFTGTSIGTITTTGTTGPMESYGIEWFNLNNDEVGDNPNVFDDEILDDDLPI